MRYVILGMLLGACWLLGTGTASANMKYLAAFKKAHPNAKANCLACHQKNPPSQANLDAYGASLLEAAEAAGTAAETETIAAANALDPDRDGVTSGDELAAGTNPSDPDSK